MERIVQWVMVIEKKELGEGVLVRLLGKSVPER